MATRIQKAPRKLDREDYIIQYPGEDSLYIQKADRRWYTEPYVHLGWKYRGAKGEIFQEDSNGCPPFYGSKSKTGVVKVFVPGLGVDDGRKFPVRVYSQAEVDQEVVLFARIEYPEWEHRLRTINGWDDKTKTLEGQWIIVRLYRSSVERFRFKDAS